MRKFTPSDWTPVKDGIIDNMTGRLVMKLADEATVFITDQDGIRSILMTGREFNVDIPGYYTVQFEKTIEGYYIAPVSRGIAPTGEKFTNTDRRPNESGAILETKKAMRSLQIEQARVMKELRNERDAIKRDKDDRAAIAKADKEAKRLEDEAAETSTATEVVSGDVVDE